MRIARAVLAPTALALCLTATACGRFGSSSDSSAHSRAGVASGGAEAGRFDSQPTVSAPTCMVHQSQQPGPAYTRGETMNTGLVLAMLGYYVRNGNLPYCDGKPATATDRAWAKTYLSLGSEPDHVSRVMR